MTDRLRSQPAPPVSAEDITPLTRFYVYGRELVVKRVRHSGNSGRVYLPPAGVAKRVKMIRVQ